MALHIGWLGPAACPKGAYVRCSQNAKGKTHTDPEDDVKVDPMMPVGSTSKTWNPRADDRFWQRQSGSGEHWGHLSQYLTQWKPRLRPERDFSSVAGETSEGSTVLPRLGRLMNLKEMQRGIGVLDSPDVRMSCLSCSIVLEGILRPRRLAMGLSPGKECCATDLSPGVECCAMDLSPGFLPCCLRFPG